MTPLEQRQRNSRLVIEGLYDLDADRLFRYLLARVGDPDAADELTTEVFIGAMRYLDRYRLTTDHPAASLSAWLYRIASSVAANYRRTQRRRPQNAEVADWREGGQAPNPERWVEEMEELEMLAQAISQLSEDQRLFIIGKFGEEMSNAEIGPMLGKSEGAVKALQHRALRTLARLLKRSTKQEVDADGHKRPGRQAGSAPAEGA
ncbi:MAG: RNA polymerase sigma factor [Anaerolineae bacterium]